jgi:S1-C subfamily serine protease
VPASDTGFLAQHVLRVQCDPGAQGGSGFVHKSGLVITAAHVVAGCSTADLRLVGSQGAAASVRTVKVDSDLDLALLTPQQPFAAGLKINPSETLMVGVTLAIWGGVR